MFIISKGDFVISDAPIAIEITKKMKSYFAYSSNIHLLINKYTVNVSIGANADQKMYLIPEEFI